MNKNEYDAPCDYWTRTSQQSLTLIETDGKLLRRVSLDHKLLSPTVVIWKRVIHSINVDQDLFYRSEIVFILECFAIPNGLLQYICENIVLHGNTKNLSIR